MVRSREMHIYFSVGLSSWHEGRHFNTCVQSALHNAHTHTLKAHTSEQSAIQHETCTKLFIDTSITKVQMKSIPNDIRDTFTV